MVSHGLNKNGSYRLIDLNAWSQYLNALGGVALLEKVCYLERDLRFQNPMPNPESPFLLSVNPDIELLANSLAPSLPACHHTFFHDNNGLNL